MAENVKVAVRVRPLSKRENLQSCQSVVEQIPPTEPQIVVAGTRENTFTYDYVFSEDKSQEMVYSIAMHPLLDKLFEGYNVTILAYGQTGSGKTFTMGTSFDGTENESMGAIPRAMNDIFEKITDMEEHDIRVTCSFVELYQEVLYDLLSEKNRDETVVDIRENANGIHIPGLTEIEVDSASKTLNCLMRASNRRAVGATAMNEVSSRSHAIFTVTIHIIQKDDGKAAVSAKFHLVDLAGSERSNKTLATGERFKEGVKINKGLLCLGNVISALGDKQSHVPYRDSKLTRLLQDSLGGNSVTLMIACISPADDNCDETISTLRYADRAKKIKNKPIINQDSQQAEIRRLNALVKELRVELMQFKKGDTSCTPIKRSSTETSINYATALKRLEIENKDLQNRNQILQIQLQSTIHNVAVIEMRADTAERSLEAIKSISDIPVPIAEILKSYKDEMKGQEEDTSSLLNDSNESLPLDEIKSKSDKHTQKQMNYNTELMQMNRELQLKEELYRKILGNISTMNPSSNDESVMDKMGEYEDTIRLLEHQISEFNEQLKTTKTADKKSKLAEERRKKVQQLEAELSEVKKKSIQQAKMLKLKEKDAQRIQVLNNEIQQMKAAKVKLLKAMRTESDNFRQWKLNREKEICQLKAKDQKRQNEMQRMETMHAKQQNVLKRKFEEAVAVNKRLKDVVEKHRAVQEKRKNSKTHKQDAEIVNSYITHELEMIMSIVEAKVTLEDLLNSRAIESERLNQLKVDTDADPEEIASLEQDIDFRNAQILDMQQKVVDIDLDSKSKNICEGLPTISDTKYALKKVLNTVAECKREYALSKLKYEETFANLENAEKIIEQYKAEKATIIHKHTDQIYDIERRYEDKLSVLLSASNKRSDANTNDTSGIDNIVQETIGRMDELRKEVEMYKDRCSQAEEELAKFTRTRRHHRQVEQISLEDIGIEGESDSDPEDESLNNSLNDPEFRLTPMHKRRKTSGSLRQTVLTKSLDYTANTQCACKTDCSGRRCSCKKAETYCTDSCKCSDACKNRVKSEVNSSEEEEENLNKENDANNPNVTVTINKCDDQHTFKRPSSSNAEENDDSIMPTPKKPKNLEIDTVEMSTPKYIYSDKKKNLFLKD